LANPAGLALRERVDAARLARGLFAAGRSEEALGILEEAAAEGDQRSLRALARHYRRVGMLEAYGEAVARLDGESLEGRIEKAKYEEHVAGNPMAALVHVQAALSMDSPMSEKTLAGLRHREARLIRKLSRRDRA
jgi:thioredoxin-like negative regulator of GroEL